MAQVFRVHGHIGRASFRCCRARDSETGQEYWTVDVYQRTQGIWGNIGTVIAYAATESEAREAAVRAGLGAVPLLGTPEFTLDGKLRGLEHALAATGTAD